MSCFILKILALVTMIIDHIGVMFFNENIIMRTIGRISFPLFVLTFVQGLIHTSNQNKYLTKIAVMSIISEPLYLLCFVIGKDGPLTHNVLFDFLIAGLFIVWGERKSCEWYEKVVLYLVAGMIALMFRTNYGLTGALSIIACYEVFRPRKNKLPEICKVIPPLLLMVDYIFDLSSIENRMYLVGLAASIPFFFAYNGYHYPQCKTEKQGKSLESWRKLLFVSYPLHMAMLLIADFLIT